MELSVSEIAKKKLEDYQGKTLRVYISGMG